MLGKFTLAAVTLLASIGFAFAQVDVNKADQGLLEDVTGIGPATSTRILDERKRGGNFRDWSDFEQRVKGIGPKRAASLSREGLRVNDQPMPDTGSTNAALGSKVLAHFSRSGVTRATNCALSF